MKHLEIAVVLLVFSIGTLEALKCNRCVSSQAGGTCRNTEETCTRPGEVCASAVTTDQSLIYSHFKRCMKASDASILNASQYYKVTTCTTDLCN